MKSLQDFQKEYADTGVGATSRASEAEADRKRMDEFFEEYMEMERKRGTLTDKRWNSLCDQLSIRLGWDFSEKKITAQTKHRRDAKLRAKAIKEEISIEKPQPHALQRLYFSAFAPSALETMVKSKLRPACCSIYSFLTLNCIIASGIAKVSKREILEKLKLSDKNALSYFKELENTALIVDNSNHRNRKKESRFYLPHTHQHAKDIFNNPENTSILGGGDWVLMTPEAIEKLTKQKKLRGTHWYVYAYLCLNTYRETGITMKALPKARVMEDLNLSVNRKAVYRVFKTLEELGLIIQEEHKKDVYFLPNILRKFAELSVKNGV